jgi:Icc-related predicted phosphoesterase
MSIERVAVKTDKKRIRIFYASDVHGSDVCFRKFLNAGKAYNADIIIFGGDLSGKLIIPIIKGDAGHHSATFQGKSWEVKGAQELDGLIKKIRFTGLYPFLMEKGDAAKFESQSEKDRLFVRLLSESIEEWVKLADERVRGSNMKCLIMPGNDDPLEIDQILAKGRHIINPDEKIVDIDGTYELMSCSYGNLTPWQCPRDIDEADLRGKIESICGGIKSFDSAIFNFHVPPYDSGLDTAPKIADGLKIVAEMGQPVMIPVGSHAIRESIETHQPLLGLHGHIHESRGTMTIGRTLCINAGSEYSEGILHGAVIDLESGRMKSHVLTSG